MTILNEEKRSRKRKSIDSHDGNLNKAPTQEVQAPVPVAPVQLDDDEISVIYHQTSNITTNLFECFECHVSFDSEGDHKNHFIQSHLHNQVLNDDNEPIMRQIKKEMINASSPKLPRHQQISMNRKEAEKAARTLFKDKETRQICQELSCE